MMYCNFSINYAENLVKSFNNIIDCKVCENDTEIIVAVKTKPIFSKSEILNTTANIKNVIQSQTNKTVYVTRNMEVYCEIENANSDNYELDFEKMIKLIGG